MYRYLSDLIHNSKRFASITLCGVVFDSCPLRLYISRGLRVYTGFSNHSFFVKCFLAACLFVWLVVLRVLFRCASCFSFSGIVADDFWEFMCEDPASCPHLYLYSVQDTVIPYKEVEQIIAMRRSGGVHVVTQCWDDSAHVAHFVLHRETYTTACLDFFRHCSHTA